MINLKEELKYIKRFKEDDLKAQRKMHVRRKADIIKKDSIINKVPNDLRKTAINEYDSYNYYTDNFF